MPTQFYDQDRDDADTQVHEHVVVRHPSIDNPTASLTVAEMEEVHSVVVDAPVVEEVDTVEETVDVETPAPVVETLHREVSKLLASPAVKQRIAEMGGWTVPMTSAQFGGYVRAEIDKWTTVARQAGIRAE